MSTEEKLQEIEALLDANGEPAVCLILGKLIAICQEQQYEIEELWTKMNRVKREALYDDY